MTPALRRRSKRAAATQICLLIDSWIASGCPTISDEVDRDAVHAEACRQLRRAQRRVIDLMEGQS